MRIGIPKGFLKEDVALASPGEIDHRSISPSETSFDEAADLLARAQKPIIVAGGGVRAAEASTELVALAERLDAPVVTTYKGKGVIDGDHPLCMGALSGSASPELRECLAAADTGLVVGSDLDAVATGGFSAELPDTLIHVTLAANDIGIAYTPTVGIVGDAREALSGLVARLDDPTGGWDGKRETETVREVYENRIADLADPSREPPTSVAALRTLREALPREAIVTADAGGFRVWGLNVFEAYGPRRYVNPGSWATMGTGLPSALGAQLANPDTPVVALCGDGGLMMALHELHTAVTEEIPITTVVFNNDDYAIISEEAERSYGLPPNAYGWSSSAIDFPTVAEGMGMTAMRADGISDLDEKVTSAIERDEPVLIEIKTDPEEPQASAVMGEQ